MSPSVVMTSQILTICLVTLIASRLIGAIIQYDEGSWDKDFQKEHLKYAVPSFVLAALWFLTLVRFGRWFYRKIVAVFLFWWAVSWSDKNMGFLLNFVETKRSFVKKLTT